MRLVVTNKLLLVSLLIVFWAKLIIFILVKEEVIGFVSLGGGSDADFYHSYALGYETTITSVWNIILKHINNYGFYSRNIISYFLLLLNLFFIPILLIKTANLHFRGGTNNQRLFLLAYFLVLIYPTLYFYVFDIYRDVFMVFSFLLSCYIVKVLLEAKGIFMKFFFFLLSIILGCFLFKLREYLGFAFLSSLFLFWIKFTKKRIILIFAVYLVLLFVMNYVNLFERLISYRGGFLENSEGSTLGLDFSNPIMFLPNFILSALGQLFGLYVTNIFAILLFLIETVPFLLMLRFILRNIGILNNFGKFLIVFFVLYASIWLIGNDNLGTAVRLRIPNYFSIYICFFYILGSKSHLQKN